MADKKLTLTEIASRINDHLKRLAQREVYAWIAHMARLSCDARFYPVYNCVKDGVIYVRVVHGNRNRAFRAYTPYGHALGPSLPEAVWNWINEVPTTRKGGE